MKHIKKTIDIAGTSLTLETGHVAQQASAAVMGRLGDTVVLVTVVGGGKRADLDYFPLSVEYVERLYAGGRIKGSRWVKREGRPTDDNVLSARLIDRSIRPLFPKDFTNEVQVVATVLSVDGENRPDTLALVTASAALAMSPIPWNGPVAAIRVGRNTTEGTFIINTTPEQAKTSDLDLVISNTKEKTVMIESNSLQVEEAIFLDAVKKSFEETTKIVDFINDFAKEVGNTKEEYEHTALDAKAMQVVESDYKKEIEAIIEQRATNEGGGDEFAKLADKILEEQKFEIEKVQIVKMIDKVFKKTLRKNVLEKQKRIDGRKIDEIRPISCMVDVLPRTHGSALFQRGQTQALTVTTLGAPSMSQLLESAEGEETKRYIHHYSFPPYSVGETGRIGAVNRREIGHGALAERALEPVIPKNEDFPYTIRVVSEILSSNGSSSMASVCGSTLSLMDAGVPILAPVAGVAMGIVTDEESDKYVVLTDIMGVEDFTGDMDFKVAGTTTGITAIQLDVKISGLTLKQIEEIVTRAREGRLFILDKMMAVINTPKESVSEYAPKIEMVKIPVEKIGEVIGPGGKMIRGIMSATGATIDVEDDGSVSISGTSQESVDKAVATVQGLTRVVTVGEEFDGEVKRILPFGAFVEFLPGKEGMVHVSQMSSEFVKDPNEAVTIGQKVHVRVLEIDDMGRINLTMLAVGQEKAQPPRSADQTQGPREQRGGYERRGSSRGGFGDRRSGPSSRGRSGPSRTGGGSFFPQDKFRKKDY